MTGGSLEKAPLICETPFGKVCCSCNANAIFVSLFGSFHAFWSLPFQVAGALYLLYRQVSASAVNESETRRSTASHALVNEKKKTLCFAAHC